MGWQFGFLGFQGLYRDTGKEDRNPHVISDLEFGLQDSGFLGCRL